MPRRGQSREELHLQLSVARQRIQELEQTLRTETAKGAGQQFDREFLGELLENIPDYIHFKDHERRFVRVSKAFENLFKRTEEEILGKRDEDLFPAQIAEETANDDRRVLAGEKIVNKLEGGEVTDGEEHWVLTTKLPWRDMDGEIRGVYGISREVTQLKKAEDALRESQRLIELTQHVGKVGSWSWNPNTGDLTWSQETYRLLGFKPWSITPSFEAFMERVHPEDREMVRQAINAALQREQPYRVDYRVLRPDGSIRTTEAVGELEVDARGKPIRLFGSCRDITDRKLAEERRLELFRDLMATVAHEIRNPLGTINNSILTLEHLCSKEGPHVAVIERARRSIQRCDRIIEELLDYARAYTTTLETTVIDPWLENFVAEQILPPGIEVQSGFASDAVVNVDRKKLHRALSNLVLNACQAMGATDERPRKITLRSECSEQWVKISVEDTGPGVPPEHQESIFEPLFSTKAFGVGLGLPIVKRIAEEHGAKVSLEPRDKPGAVFVFALPVMESST